MRRWAISSQERDWEYQPTGCLRLLFALGLLGGLALLVQHLR